MVWGFLKSAVSAVAEWSKSVIFPAKATIDNQRQIAKANVEANQALAERRDKMQLAQLQLQYIQEQERREFQVEQSQLSTERSKELQLFIQRAEDARLQKNLDFQRWRLEQERELQLQFIQLNQEFQRELAAEQRKNSRELLEEQKKLENSPIWLVASQILEHDPGEKMRVFLAPPQPQFERLAGSTSSAKDFPNIELTLAEGLRNFFKKYSVQNRPIDFLGGAWVSKTFHSEASIKALFSVLKSEPTLVLESEIDGDYLNFRVAYWCPNWIDFRYDSVLSKLPYRDILYDAAKSRARRWPEIRAKLMGEGQRNAEEIDSLYGKSNVQNLKTLQEEERAKELGINPVELGLNYVVSKQDFDELCQFLIIYHCLFAGLVADEYFLIEYNLPPLLPQLLPELTKDIPDHVIVQEMIQAVVSYYQRLYEMLEEVRSAWIPELSLELATSLVRLPGSWANEQIINSIKSWLKLRELPQLNDLSDLLDSLELVLQIEDQQYVEKLNRCLIAVGMDKQLSVAEACYKRGNSRSREGNYEEAIADYNQAIKLNSNWAEAFYNRGLANARLGFHRKAVQDYTESLKINSSSADTFNNRGNAYYRLGDYDRAISDYNQALAINPDFTEAAKNRDIAQGVLEVLQQREEEQKLKLENFTLADTIKNASGGLYSLTVSTDGQILVSSSSNTRNSTYLIKLWELDKKQANLTFSGHTGTVFSVIIRPGAQRMLVSCSADQTVKLWDSSSGELIRTLTGHTNSVYSVAITPDGQVLASGSEDKTIRLWEISTGEEIRSLLGHTEAVSSLAIDPNGQMLISGSNDKSIRLWKLSTGEEINSLTGHTSSVRCLAISLDGQILASGSGDATIKLWNLATGQEICTLAGHTGLIRCLVISPDGRMLASASEDKTIKIWDISSHKNVCTFTEHTNYVTCLALKADGKLLISGSLDETIKFWQAAQ